MTDRPCPKHPDRECKPKRTRCQECLDKLRDYQRRRREARKKDGLCVGTVGRSDCKNPPREGKTMCAECAAKFNEYQLRKLNERKRETR